MCRERVGCGDNSREIEADLVVLVGTGRRRGTDGVSQGRMGRYQYYDFGWERGSLLCLYSFPANTVVQSTYHLESRCACIVTCAPAT